jgi:cytochrome c-type biogenesis protein CcmH/NrfG
VVPDLGGAWRQEILRRLEEERLAAAAARPAPPPAPRRRVAARWRAAAERLGGPLRRGPEAAAATDTPEARPETTTADAPVGVWEEAMHSCEEALAARPDLVGVWVGLSLAAGRLGDFELSEGAYGVARVLSPDEADAWRDALRRDFPEIELTETVKNEIVLSDELTTSGNGR